MTTQYMLTTVDNPHSPFDDFDAWYNFDTTHDYGTLSLLGRLTQWSHDLSDVDEALAVEDAIDEIVSENVSGMHMKVSKMFPDSSD